MLDFSTFPSTCYMLDTLLSLRSIKKNLILVNLFMTEPACNLSAMSSQVQAHLKHLKHKYKHFHNIFPLLFKFIQHSFHQNWYTLIPYVTCQHYIDKVLIGTYIKWKKREYVRALQPQESLEVRIKSPQHYWCCKSEF